MAGRRLLTLLLVVQGVSGAVGGLGLVLLLVLGVAPLVAAYGVWTRRPWAWPASFLVGIALIVWIGVEILVVGFHPSPPLQPLYGALGLAISLAALLPAARRVGRGGP